MGDEKAVVNPDGEKVGLQSRDLAQDATKGIVKDAEPESHTNGTSNTAAGKSPSEKIKEKSKSPVQDSFKDSKPSKRVQEAQRYNDRPRNHYHRSDRKPYNRNIKSDLTSQKESSDPVAIRKQVEFYFSESNLLTDAYLFKKVDGHQNLPVPISMIHSFKRMRHFQPVSAIVDALKESKILDIVEDDTSIQRKEPLSEGVVGKPMDEVVKLYEDQAMSRSIYAKGFGDEGPSTQFDIEAFFANYGATNSVRLRRTDSKVFKGSVFVEFDSVATQESFLSLAAKPEWHGKELLIKSKKQYCEEKIEDIKNGKVRANEHDDRRDSHYRSNHKGRRDSPDYNRGTKERENDDRDWRVRREDDKKSGFKDRNGGKHRGYGSSGRGRGGRRNDQGHGDRNRERDGRDERGVPKVRSTTPDASDEVPTKIELDPEAERLMEQPQTVTEASDALSASNSNGNKPVDPIMEHPPKIAATAEHSTPTNTSSKKRAREEDDSPEEEQVTKKVDNKSGEP